MAALVPIKVLGYAPGDPVTSVEMNLVNTQLPKAPNFVDGDAEYNPAGLIQIGGAGFQWNGPSVFASTSTTNFEGAANVQSATGRLYVNTSGQIVVQTSGEIVIQSGGAMTWESGALITAEDGSTFNLQDGSVLNLAGIMNFGATSEIHGDPTLMSGAELTAASGSIVNLGGTTTLTGGTELNLSPARAWTRRNLRICGTTTTAHVGGDRSAEEIMGVPPAATRGPVVAFLNGSSRVTLLEIDDLPDGATMAQVQLRTHGTGPIGLITDEAVYKIIRWIDDQVVEDMSAAVDDSHDVGTWETDITQTLTVNAHSTIDRAYRYAVQIVHHQVNVDVSMFVWGVVATGTTTQLRP